MTKDLEVEVECVTCGRKFKTYTEDADYYCCLDCMNAKKDEYIFWR